MSVPSWFNIGYLAIGVNATCFAVYLIQWAEPGKILYWFGALVITISLLLMRG